jgi:rod shape-determining protein MreC
LSSKRKRIIAVVVFLVIFVFLSLSVTVSRSVKEVSTGFFSPLLSVMRAVGQKLEDIWDATFHSNNMVRESLRKERENLKLRAELVLAREKIRELGSLHSQLEELAKLPFEVIPAKVLGRDPDIWYQSFVIGRGTNHGVGRGMPVVCGENLVGRVIEVGARWSRVRLILDPQSAIPAVTNGGQATGIVVGNGSDPLSMTYVKHNEQLKVGDLVLTAHLGKVLDEDQSPLPQGFVIGRVVGVLPEEEGLYKSARLESAVRFRDLREVFVVVPK